MNNSKKKGVFCCYFDGAFQVFLEQVEIYEKDIDYLNEKKANRMELKSLEETLSKLIGQEHLSSEVLDKILQGQVEKIYFTANCYGSTYSAVLKHFEEEFFGRELESQEFSDYLSKLTDYLDEFAKLRLFRI